MIISSLTSYVLICYLNYLYILVIIVDELMNCIDHCFAPAHVYFFYLVKTNLTLLMGTKWWSGGTHSPMTI